MPTDTTDTDLVLSCQAGHMEDFDALYTRHLKGIFAFIYYRTMNRAIAEDLTSTTFLKALEHLGSYDAKKGAFSTWLYRIARNTVHDHFRTYREHKNIEDAWDLPSDDSPSEDAATKQSRDDVRAALKQLPADKREIVLMRLWDNLSYKEIAELTGKSEASCKMTFFRVVSDLRGSMTLTAFLMFILFPPHL